MIKLDTIGDVLLDVILNWAHDLLQSHDILSIRLLVDLKKAFDSISWLFIDENLDV